MTDIRSRSPRCPSITLGEALNRVENLYSKENKHFVAPDIAAVGLGYKNASSGTAVSVVASLIYYGLLKRAKDGKLAVSPDFEKYKYAPDASIKYDFLEGWLNEPKVFGELLKKYSDSMPSDGALKYELIESGFKPDSADDAARIFKESVSFVKNQQPTSDSDYVDDLPEEATAGGNESSLTVKKVDASQAASSLTTLLDIGSSSDKKSVTVFLPNKREALIIVPRPFFNKDRDAIKRQLDALLTEEDEAE